MRISRYGHAALLIEAAGVRVLLDPGNLSAEAAFALTGLDAIAVTHQHPDHVDIARLPGLLAANPGARLLAEPQIADDLRGLGGAWEDTVVGATVEVGGLALTGVGGRHAVIHPDLVRVGNVGLLVSAADEPTLFHPGDSYEYAPNGVDVLAVPLAAPWAKVSETVDFVRSVAPRIVLPIHDRTLADLAHPMYWSRVEDLGGAEARLLAQDGVTSV